MTTDSKKKESNSSLAVQEVEQHSALFHDADGNAYAEIERDRHIEILPIDSKQFLYWIGHRYFNEHGKIINKNSLSDAVNTLKGKALFEGPEHEVSVRVAKYGESYYIDPCLDSWHFFEITHQKYKPVSWKIEPKVRFIRTSTMREWAVPDYMSKFSHLPGLLEKHFTVSKNDLKLLIVWLVETLRPDTPYPILELIGEQGSAKSSTQEKLRRIIDPNRVNLRAAPRSNEDLYVSAGNNHVVSLNNLSHISAGLSDALCSLSTGGGYASRTLYTNSEETCFDIKRPVVINGISTLIIRGDLKDRSLRIDLPIIPPEKRKPESQIWADFEKDLPGIVGALLDTFSKVLGVLPNVTLSRLPRMADFALLGQAISKLYGWDPSFIKIYEDNRQRSIERTVESSPVTAAVIDMIDRNGPFKGTVKQLWDKLESYRNGHGSWPQSYKGLADTIRRNSPALRAIGINVEWDPVRRMDGYHIKIFMQDNVHRSSEVHEHLNVNEHHTAKVFTKSDSAYEGSQQPKNRKNCVVRGEL